MMVTIQRLLLVQEDLLLLSAGDAEIVKFEESFSEVQVAVQSVEQEGIWQVDQKFYDVIKALMQTFKQNMAKQVGGGDNTRMAK